MVITYSTNPGVLCRDCHHRPVVILNGKQATRCGSCMSNNLRVLGGLFSDFEMLVAADRLEELMATAAQTDTADARH